MDPKADTENRGMDEKRWFNEQPLVIEGRREGRWRWQRAGRLERGCVAERGRWLGALGVAWLENGLAAEKQQMIRWTG